MSSMSKVVKGVGPVMIIVNGPIYRFSIRIGRIVDLAVWERKDW